MSTEVDETAGARPLEHRAGPRHRSPTPKEYVRVGVILAVLTGIEVWLSYSGIRPGALIPLLWLATATKFLMVVSYFMHLKFDDRRYARFFVMGGVGAFTLYVIVLLTFGVFQR